MPDDPAGAGTTTAEQTTTEDRTTTAEDNPERVGDDDGQAGVDISGPCDEAEHANDPRCTVQDPAAGGRRPRPESTSPARATRLSRGGDDNSGRGRGRGRGGDEPDDD